MSVFCKLVSLHNITSEFPHNLYSLSLSLMSVAKTPEPVQDGTPTVADLLRLQQQGILSKREVRRLVLQSLDRERDTTASSAQKSDGYKTPPSQTKKRKRTPQFFDAEVTGAVDNHSFPTVRSENIDPEVSVRSSHKKAKKTRGRSTPCTTKLRRLVKDVTRQRFLQQCMDKDSLLWYQTDAGQMLDKMLFARAAQHCMTQLYRSYPESLHGVPGKKLLSVISWQVMFIY